MCLGACPQVFDPKPALEPQLQHHSGRPTPPIPCRQVKPAAWFSPAMQRSRAWLNVVAICVVQAAHQPLRTTTFRVPLPAGVYQSAHQVYTVYRKLASVHLPSSERGYKQLGYRAATVHLAQILALLLLGWGFLTLPLTEPLQVRCSSLAFGFGFASVATQLILAHMCKVGTVVALHRVNASMYGTWPLLDLPCGRCGYGWPVVLAAAAFVVVGLVLVYWVPLSWLLVVAWVAGVLVAAVWVVGCVGCYCCRVGLRNHEKLENGKVVVVVLSVVVFFS